MSQFISPNIIVPLDGEQLKILQTLIENLSSSQIMWLSGYLWGLVINHDKQSYNVIMNKDVKLDGKVCSVVPSITILSASQTGNARQVAKRLYDALVINQSFNVQLINVGDYKFKNISKERLLFLVISTYGEGEPPEEAVSLYKYLFSNKVSTMKETNFAVFGLGDRSYEYFSKAGKDFDFRLEELGGHRLYQRVDADLDYENQACIWCQEIVNTLDKQLSILNFHSIKAGSNISNNIKVSHNTDLYTKEKPLSAYLMSRQKITSRSSIKDVYHLEIDLSGSGLYYYPGDALGVWYENDMMLVHEFLEYCGFSGKEEVFVQKQSLSLSVALQKYYELTHNMPIVAKKYSDLIQNQELSSLLFNKEKLKVFVSSVPIIDMIRRWTPNSIIPEQLLSVLRPLTPRYYSIASSQKEVEEEVHITVGMVCYNIDGYIRTGGASGYLVNQLSSGHIVRVFVVSNHNFRLPNNYNTPIIMIAAGTGIAPFRAFIQERSADNAHGKNWLFFGNVHFVDDFLYQREWQDYVRNGLLNNIDTAWSRDQDKKVYIQDKILEKGFEIWQWIQEGAYVYVCGDARNMACGVNNILIRLGIEYGGMSLEQSNEFWDNMRVQNRYQRDIY